MAAPVPTNPTPTGAAPGGAAVGANPSTPYASASLYVGDLAADVTEALLFEIFNAVGPVASVRVCRDAATRRSLGYAYVNFHRVDDAERALDTMNFKNIRNRPCRIMWSHRDPALRRSGVGNVFVNHLAKSIDNKQLYDTFSMFGNILSCKVAMNGKRESLGYGFVHYESDESAQAAIQRVDGKVIAGQKVSVSTFKSKKERGGANKFKYTNVFVKNLPGEITKEQVDALFSKHGTVTSSMLTADRENKQRAFGFINFAAPEEAAAAVEALHDTEYQGKKLYVSRAMKKDEREKELREKFEQLKNERQKKYAGVNLYVKNLSDEMDDERLNQEFAKFGSISSAKIMRDQAGKSRGFGFVCYSTPEEATKAVTEMNGRMLDGKPLYVALAQRKEMRRAQLESQYAQRAKMGGPMQGQGVLNGPMQPQMGYPAQQQPMFLGGIPPQQRNYMYPQQVVPRWAGPQGPNQGMMGAVAMGARGPHPNINYQLMPVNPRGPQGQPQMGPGGMPNGAGPRAAQQQQQRAGAQQHPGAGQNRGPRPAQVQGQPQIYQQQGMQQQGQNIRYTDNVRNRAANAGMPMVQQQQQVPAEQVVMPAPNEPLTIKALAAAPEEMRKQMIGERLFPLIKLQEPALAGKITGMLLEMDNGELIHLLESQQALQEKIAEALQVLQQHPMEHQEETDK